MHKNHRKVLGVFMRTLFVICLKFKCISGVIRQQCTTTYGVQSETAENRIPKSVTSLTKRDPVTKTPPKWAFTRSPPPNNMRSLIKNLYATCFTFINANLLRPLAKGTLQKRIKLKNVSQLVAPFFRARKKPLCMTGRYRPTKRRSFLHAHSPAINKRTTRQEFKNRTRREAKMAAASTVTIVTSFRAIMENPFPRCLPPK